MIDTRNWDWEPGEKKVVLADWSTQFNWVEEFYASPDGEKIAAVVNVDEGEFNVCVNGETWENVFDKIWYLRFAPDGRLTALVSEVGEWTLAVDGAAWENKFGYVWNTLFSSDGKNIAVAAQKDMKYCMVRNGIPWEDTYTDMTYFALSPDGNQTAAAVQVVGFDQAEVHKFQEGAYSVALDGKAWDTKFVNVWNMAISQDGAKLATEVRLSLYDYTIAVNDQTWEKTYQCVWEPRINPAKGTVVAPVRVEGKWALAEDSRIIWDQRFVQLWHQIFSSDGKKVAAIVAPQYGRWTVAIDGRPWSVTFSDLVTDTVFSPDGVRIAAVAKEGPTWKLVVDGSVWSNTFDMAWKPVFSSDGANVAAKVEKDGNYTVIVNDCLWEHECDDVFEPAFSPDGTKILLKAIEKGTYYRRVVPVSAITG